MDHCNEQLPRDPQVTFMFFEDWSRLGHATKIRNWGSVVTQIFSSRIEPYKKVRKYGQKNKPIFLFVA